MASPVKTSTEDLHAWIASYTGVHIDLGTGDGTYALYLARTNPHMAVIGVDTCLDNRTKAARRGLPNLRFVACDATAPPHWLHALAASVSINFPFGSLLRALVDEDMEVQQRLFAIAKPGAQVDIRINGSAAKELGMPSRVVEDRLLRLTRAIAEGPASVTVEAHEAFRRFPSGWAKRLAHGRPSQVIVATACIGAYVDEPWPPMLIGVPSRGTR